MSLADFTLWVHCEYWLPVPVPREDTVRTVRGLYPAACRLLGVVTLFVGDARSSTLRWETWCQRLGRLSGSWLSRRDSMHPFLGHSQWVWGIHFLLHVGCLCFCCLWEYCSRLQLGKSWDPTVREVSSRARALPRAGLYLPGVVSPMTDLKAPCSFICHWLWQAS